MITNTAVTTVRNGPAAAVAPVAAPAVDPLLGGITAAMLQGALARHGVRTAVRTRIR
jgi:hypothetical protein